MLPVVIQLKEINIYQDTKHKQIEETSQIIVADLGEDGKTPKNQKHIRHIKLKYTLKFKWPLEEEIPVGNQYIRFSC